MDWRRVLRLEISQASQRAKQQGHGLHSSGGQLAGNYGGQRSLPNVTSAWVASCIQSQKKRLGFDR